MKRMVVLICAALIYPTLSWAFLPASLSKQDLLVYANKGLVVIQRKHRAISTPRKFIRVYFDVAYIKDQETGQWYLLVPQQSPSLPATQQPPIK